MNNVILVIEDNPAVRESISKLLSTAGYKVITAANGKAGLEEAAKQKPVLILCDVIMPSPDGYGATRAIDDIPGLSGTPTLCLTSKTERTDFRSATDLHGDDRLSTRFTDDELIRAVTARLRKGQHPLLETAQPAMSRDDFAGTVDFEEISRLSPNTSMKQFRIRDYIYMEGDTATHLLYLVSGKIKTFKTNEGGKEYITELVAPGQFFGHLALLGDGVQHQTAAAIENSEVALIPRNSFFEILANNHSFSIRFLRFLSRSLTDWENRLIHLAYNSARKRVAEALLLLYRQYGDGEDQDCVFPVNRENLSAIAGISPESVSRNLSNFKEENLIQTRNHTIRITDFHGLRELRG